MNKILLTTCREQKSTRKEGGGVNLRTGKLKRIKTLCHGTRGIAVSARP